MFDGSRLFAAIYLACLIWIYSILTRRRAAGLEAWCLVECLVDSVGLRWGWAIPCFFFFLLLQINNNTPSGYATWQVLVQLPGFSECSVFSVIIVAAMYVGSNFAAVVLCEHNAVSTMLADFCCCCAVWAMLWAVVGWCMVGNGSVYAMWNVLCNVKWAQMCVCCCQSTDFLQIFFTLQTNDFWIFKNKWLHVALSPFVISAHRLPS